MKTYLTSIIFLILFLGCMQNACAESILEAQIKFVSISKDSPQKIQPGSQVQIQATIKNIGTESSPKGQIYVRFVYPSPLDKTVNSQLYISEKLDLPSIEPGKDILISFQSSHIWPTILDFVRQDWGLRQYQAVAAIGGKENVIGRTSITYSAYYYQGPVIELPVSYTE